MTGMHLYMQVMQADTLLSRSFALSQWYMPVTAQITRIARYLPASLKRTNSCKLMRVYSKILQPTAQHRRDTCNTCTALHRFLTDQCSQAKRRSHELKSLFRLHLSAIHDSVIRYVTGARAAAVVSGNITEDRQLWC